MTVRADRARQRRAMFIAAGLCSKCGRIPPMADQKRCVECNAGRSRYYNTKVASGVCPCGNALTSGRRCAVCLKQSKIIHYNLVLTVLNAYGTSCKCCGYDKIPGLTIDHIAGGGRRREKIEGTGAGFYRWLKRSDFPDGYQTLCANCNHGKARNGGLCPHYGKPKMTSVKRRELTALIITKYGSKCAICAETEKLFLNIDHIDDDGYAHRKMLGHKSIFVWLRNNNYPDGFQVLCDNCNLTKSRKWLAAHIGDL